LYTRTRCILGKLSKTGGPAATSVWLKPGSASEISKLIPLGPLPLCGVKSIQ